MVACSLLIMASGVIGWKAYQMIENKRFQSETEKLRSQFFSCHRLALNMQADWRGVLRKLNDQWVFEAICLDHPNKKKLPPIFLHSYTVVFKGTIQNELTLDFFSSGAIFPQGELVFYQNFGDPKSRLKTYKFPDLFSIEEGNGEKVLGPIHPDDF